MITRQQVIDNALVVFDQTQADNLRRLETALLTSAAADDLNVDDVAGVLDEERRRWAVERGRLIGTVERICDKCAPALPSSRDGDLTGARPVAPRDTAALLLSMLQHSGVLSVDERGRIAIGESRLDANAVVQLELLVASVRAVINGNVWQPR
jgi:hypothetical protein